MKESPIFSRSYDMLCWLIPVTVKFPRQQRFVLAAAMQRTALGFQERLIEATAGGRADVALRQADVALTKLRFYVRLCRDLELLTARQHAHAGQLLGELGRLLGGWRKAAEGRKTLES